MEYSKQDYTELSHIMCDHLGYSNDGNGKYYHKDLHHSIDLSAIDQKMVMHVLANSFAIVGKENLRAELKNLLGID